MDLGHILSYALGTFDLASSLWWISFHTGQVFLIHTSRAYLALCLHHDRFLLCALSFSNLCALGIFDFTPSSWHIFLHTSRVFSTRMPRAYLALHLRHGIFLFMWVRHIWICVFTMMNFSSCRSGFSNSCVLGIFGLVPLLLWILVLFESFIRCFSSPSSGAFQILHPLSDTLQVL